MGALKYSKEHVASIRAKLERGERDLGTCREAARCLEWVEGGAAEIQEILESRDATIISLREEIVELRLQNAELEQQLSPKQDSDPALADQPGNDPEPAQDPEATEVVEEQQVGIPDEEPKKKGRK
jgi:hypothetical protein